MGFEPWTYGDISEYNWYMSTQYFGDYNNPISIMEWQRDSEHCSNVCEMIN